MANILNLTNLCNQRRQQMLFNIPPSRNELQPSPYISVAGKPSFTKDQLDMRRKAEILKYKTSGQTNNPSKKEKFSQISRGKYQGNVLFCPQDISIPTLTSASGVPGPIIYLVNDSTVPLYNYATNKDSKGIINVTNNNNYSTLLIVNAQIFSSIKSSIASLYIRNNNNISLRSFKINSPFGIYITGKNIEPTGNFEVKIKVTTINTTTFYSGSQVISVGGIPTYSYSVQEKEIELDLIPPPENLVTDTNFTYSAFVNLGNLKLSNINLFTQNGYIYDIKTEFLYTLYSPNSIIVNNSNATLYMNLTSDFYKSIEQNINPLSGTPIAFNCKIVNRISNDIYEPPSLFV